MVAGNTVAANARGNFALASLNIAFEFFLSLLRIGWNLNGKSRHESDKQAEQGQQQFLHFARTIMRWEV